MTVRIHEEDCDCFGCKARSVSFAPTAMPSRMNLVPTRKPDNSWEKGIATDDRGVPLLTESGALMGVKEAGVRRHEIEQRKRELVNRPAP